MNYILGNEVYFAEDPDGCWAPRNAKGQFISLKDLRCTECGKKSTKEGHDPCLGKLPGVINACCGHNKKGHNKDGTGYIMFENGMYIEGYFTKIKKFERG